MQARKFVSSSSRTEMSPARYISNSKLPSASRGLINIGPLALSYTSLDTPSSASTNPLSCPTYHCLVAYPQSLLTRHKVYIRGTSEGKGGRGRGWLVVSGFEFSVAELAELHSLMKALLAPDSVISSSLFCIYLFPIWPENCLSFACCCTYVK